MILKDIEYQSSLVEGFDICGSNFSMASATDQDIQTSNDNQIVGIAGTAAFSMAEGSIFAIVSLYGFTDTRIVNGAIQSQAVSGSSSTATSTF